MLADPDIPVTIPMLESSYNLRVHRMSTDLDLYCDEPSPFALFTPFRFHMKRGEIETEFLHDADETIDIRVVVSGVCRRTVTGGDAIWMTEGQTYVVGTGRQSLLPGFRDMSFRVNADAMQLPRAQRLNEFDGSGPVGMIMSTTLRQIFEAAQKDTPEIVDRLGSGLAAFVREVLVARQTPEDLRGQGRSGLLSAMTIYIDQNIQGGLHRLSAQHMTRKFGMSRATLYRLFKEHGGYERCIQTRRIKRACELLETTPKSRGAVARIAQSLGYDDPSHFNRLVRKARGVPPGRLLGSKVSE